MKGTTLREKLADDDSEIRRAAALACAKKAFYAWDSIHLDKGLARAEKTYLEDLMRTEDAKEGVQAWMEKRKPQWKGK